MSDTTPHVDLHGKIGKYPIWAVGVVVGVGIIGFMWWRSHQLGTQTPAAAPAATPQTPPTKPSRPVKGQKPTHGGDPGRQDVPQGDPPIQQVQGAQYLTSFGGTDFDYPSHTTSHPLDYMTDVVGGNTLIHPDSPKRQHELVGYDAEIMTPVPIPAWRGRNAYRPPPPAP